MQKDDRAVLADLEAATSSNSLRKGMWGIGVVPLIIIYYAACSSTMLIINKVAIHHLPAPAFLLLCQLMASAIAVKSADALGVVEADQLEWGKARKFMWVVLGFLGTIFANIKVLQHTSKSSGFQATGMFAQFSGNAESCISAYSLIASRPRGPFSNP